MGRVDQLQFKALVFPLQHRGPLVGLVSLLLQPLHLLKPTAVTGSADTTAALGSMFTSVWPRQEEGTSVPSNPRRNRPVQIPVTRMGLGHSQRMRNMGQIIKG